MKRKKQEPAVVEVLAETFERLRKHCNRTGESMKQLIDALTQDLDKGN